MTEETTNPGDGEAMPEVVDGLTAENDALESAETNQDADDLEGDDEFEDVVRGEQTYRVPKALAGELLMQADYTKKTQEVAQQRQALESQQQQVQQAAQRQMAFAQDIASFGALNSRLAPFSQVQDWPTYLRTGGPEAAAHYAEYQALVSQRDALARNVQAKVQQQAHAEEQELQRQITIGRQELSKHIKGYGPDTLSKLETFAAPFGFSSDRIRQAEADPGSIRILHLAMVGQQALQQQKQTSTIAQGARTAPVKTLRGAGGRIAAKPDTNDFAAFERMADEKLRAAR